ncbi:MAG: DUF58 domain-containing protein, partial [Gracilibacteraceae bacterium]|nr:DUF58 domain-containing protein [Gracilibacteraceae bacterium]
LTFLTVLVALPLILNLLNVFGMRSIRVETDVSGRALRKGESVRLTVNVRTLTPAFVFLRLVFHETPHFSTEYNASVALVPWRNTIRRLERFYTAAVWGAAPLGVRGLEATDFFGLCRYVMVQEEKTSGVLAPEIEIVPNLPDLRENELLHEIMAARATDDETEAREALPFSAGMPGFEHREYAPGDPLKRINWKLSARLNTYMVRLNEPAERLKLSIILDRSAPPLRPDRQGSSEEIRRDERLVEAMLGLTLLSVRAGMRCTVYIFLSGRWQENVLETESEVIALQYRMARFRFTRAEYYAGAPEAAALQKPEISGESGTMLFLTNRDVASAGAVTQAGAEVLTVTAKNQAGAWLVTPEFTFVREWLT